MNIDLAYVMAYSHSGIFNYESANLYAYGKGGVKDVRCGEHIDLICSTFKLVVT